MSLSGSGTKYLPNLKHMYNPTKRLRSLSLSETCIFYILQTKTVYM